METTESPIGGFFYRPAQLEKAHAIQPQQVTATPGAKIQTTNASLIGPRTDILMIGGASIIVCILYWMFVDPVASTANIAVFAFYLSFVVNYPHFAASYQLLYGDYRKLILRKKSFFWAAVISPILIIGALTVAIQTANQELLAFLVQFMYLTVGWHYVKQIYGVSLVASAVQKRYFGVWEKNLILLNLYSVWAMSWVSANLSISKYDLDGVAYFTLGLPDFLMTAVYATTALTLILTAFIMVRKFIKTGVRPATSSLVGFASIYFWYLPSIGHPLFFFMIPFFHSLQYMLFVFALKKNEATLAGNKQISEEQQRRLFIKKLWGFLIVAAVLGTLGFELVPRSLDKFAPIVTTLPYTTLWLFAISLFINLHHYFIDNVIWRGDNEFLKNNLILASQKRATL